MLMESMLLGLNLGEGALREDGIVAKCRVIIIQGALAHAEGGYCYLF